MPKRFPLLLTPGPTPVPPKILRVLGQPLFHHRTSEYQKLFEEVSKGLQRIFRTRHPVYTFASSGTGAMEAAIVNFHSPGDKILVVEGGKFAERFTHIAKAYGLEVDVVKVRYGQAISAADLEKEVQNKPEIKSVCLQLCETSTGVVYDLAEIGRRLKDKGPLLIVDAISGLGADRFEMDAWGIDLAISASQKGLMLPPGLGFLAVSTRAQARMREAKLPRFYFDLSLYEKALGQWDTPFTPAISLVVSLREAIRKIEREGFDRILKRTEQLAIYTRKQVKKLGLEFFAAAPSNAVTSVKVPDGIDGEKLVKWIRDKEGISIAGGQGEMKGRVIRIAHMGYIRKDDIDRGIAALRKALRNYTAEKLKIARPKSQATITQ